LSFLKGKIYTINRHEASLHQKISQTPLQMGDVLLVQGPHFNLSALEKNNTFRVLGTFGDKLRNYRRAWIAMTIFVGTLILAVFNVVSLPVAVLIGTLLVFLTRCITPEEAYREVEWKAIILIGSMLAFGSAMEYTGTANYLAEQIVSLTGQVGPIWLLSGFFVLTTMLTVRWSMTVRRPTRSAFSHGTLTVMSLWRIWMVRYSRTSPRTSRFSLRTTVPAPWCG
jgi:di/tricarboxylate transporter